MSKTSMSIRLDSEVKEQAQQVFNHLGMDMTTAINISSVRLFNIRVYRLM